MSFIETALLDRVAYGFTGGPTFLTTVAELFSGIDARNAERTRPLYTYNAPYDAIDTDNHDIVIAAFIACLGGLHGFRFKDRADFSATAEILGTAAGGADETMQLIKTYTFGSESVERTIVKPVSDNFQLYEDASPLASSLDTTTGIVTFTSTIGKVITADYEFDVPVRFNQDKLAFSFVNWAAHSTDIDLKEDWSA